MKQIKKLAGKQGIMLVVIGLVMIALGLVGINSGLRYFFTVGNMNQLYTEIQPKEKKFVKANVYAIMDYVAEDDQGYYYLVPTSEDQYTIVYVFQSGAKKFNKLMEATWAYMDGKTEYIEARSIRFHGVVYYRTSDLLVYTKQWFGNDDYFGDAFENHISPYVVMYVPLSEWFGFWDWFLSLVAGIGAFLLLYGCFFTLTNGGTRHIKKYFKKLGLTVTDIDNRLATSEAVGDVIFSQHEIIFPEGLYVEAIGYNDLIYTYLHHTITTHRTYGIKTGTSNTYRIFLFSRDGKKHSTTVKSEEVGNAVIQKIALKNARTFIGANPQLLQMQAGNFKGMVAAFDAKGTDNLFSQTGYDMNDFANMDGKSE